MNDAITDIDQCIDAMLTEIRAAIPEDDLSE